MDEHTEAGANPLNEGEVTDHDDAVSAGGEDLPSILRSCLDGLHQARSLHEQINDDYPDCGRLLDRCLFFLPDVDEAPANAPTKPFETLLSTIREILILCRTFLLSSIYRTLISPSNRKQHLANLVRHHSALWQCAHALNASHRINRQEWRHQDIEDARQAFKLCVDRLLDDYSELGAQADDLIADLLDHIEANQPFISDLVQQIGHDPLLSYEQDLFTRELVALQETVRQRHTQILTQPSLPISSPSTDDERLRKSLRASLIQPHVLSPHQVYLSSRSLGGASPGAEVFQGSFQQDIPVAIKVLSLKPHSADKYAREIRELENQVVLLRHLSHPCVLKCYGIVHTPVHVMRVTELAAYGNLDTLQSCPLAWPVDLPLAWMLDLADALSYLHCQGVHHGAWRLAHVLVHSGLRLKLYAFGTASARPFPRRPGPHRARRDAPRKEGEEEEEEDWVGQDLQGWARCVLPLLTRSLPRQMHDRRRHETPWTDVPQAVRSLPPTPRRELVRWLERCRTCRGGAGQDDGEAVERGRCTAREVCVGLAGVVAMAGGDWRLRPPGRDLEAHVAALGLGKGKEREDRSPPRLAPSGTSRREADAVPELCMEDVQQLARTVNLRDVAMDNDLGPVRVLDQYRAWSFVPEINRKYAFEAQGWYTFGNVTALGIACSLGHADLVALLMHHPYLEINENNNEYGWAPLHFAADRGHTAVVQALLQDGMLDVNRRTKGGETALFMACVWGHGPLVQLLLSDPRTDVNIPKKSWTALHKATDKGQADIVRALVAHPKLDVNQATDLGDTALHLAAYNGDLACLEALLAHPALDVNRTNVDGQTALEILCHGYFVSEDHKEEMASLLRRRGATRSSPAAHTLSTPNHPIDLQPAIL